MLDIEESTSRSQYTRAKSMLEGVLVKKKIISDPSVKKTFFGSSKVAK
jgi:RNA polymerase sigma-70 factor (ECF subfamily)